MIQQKVNEKYILLWNDKTVKNKEKWNSLKPYIKKYNIKVITLNDYLNNDINKLIELGNNTVNPKLKLSGLNYLVNQKVQGTYTPEQIIKSPNDYLKSFILVILDEFNSVVEVIPNGCNRLCKGGTAMLYFKEMYE